MFNRMLNIDVRQEVWQLRKMKGQAIGIAKGHLQEGDRKQIRKVC